MHPTMTTLASRAAAGASRSAASSRKGGALSFADHIARFGGGPTSSTTSSLAPVASSSSSNSLSPLARSFPSLRAVRVQTPDRFEGKPLGALLRRHLPALKFHNPECTVDVTRWSRGSRGKAKAGSEGEAASGDAAQATKKGKSKKVTLEFDNLVPREIIVAKKNEAQITREILDMCMFVSKSGGQQQKPSAGAPAAPAPSASQPATSAPASA